VIHKGELIWHQPLQSEIQISCPLPNQQSLDAFTETLMRRSKAGLNLQVITTDGTNICAEFNCRFVGLNKGK